MCKWRIARFLRDSSSQNGFCLVSTNSLATLDTRSLRESTTFVKVLSNLLTPLMSEKKPHGKERSRIKDLRPHLGIELRRRRTNLLFKESPASTKHVN